MTDDRYLDDDAQRAWRSYVAMQQTLQRHLAQHMQRDFGMSDADFEVMVNLSEAPRRRMRAVELGEATQWEKSRLSHHLSRMEKRGLIERAPGDGRYPDVVLTQRGLDAIRCCAPANAERVRRLFVDVLGRERLAALKEMADDVVRAIDDHKRTECSLRGDGPSTT